MTFNKQFKEGLYYCAVTDGFRKDLDAADWLKVDRDCKTSWDLIDSILMEKTVEDLKPPECHLEDNEEFKFKLPYSFLEGSVE